MKRISDFENVQVFDSVEFPKAGGYIGVIVNARDVPDKEYLELLVDINDGDFKGFYKNWYDNTGKWLLRGYCSYKTTAVRIFKGFITSVEESNRGYKWDWDESTLINKKVGIILREEQYIKNDGSVGESVKINSYRSTDAIRKGEFKVPEKKLVEQQTASVTPFANTAVSSLDDIAF